MCTCGATGPPPNGVGSGAQNGPCPSKVVEGARRDLRARSPQPEMTGDGQEPACGPERSRLFPLRHLTRVCVTFRVVGARAPFQGPEGGGEVIGPVSCLLVPLPPTPCIIGNFHLKIFLSNV